MQPEYNKNLHRFALATAICTFFLVIAGGLVTSTGSALAVPDWPLSYGKLMPPMVGGIFYEHFHRMVATLVGLLTVILTVWIWRKEERSWVRILSLFALITVIMQGFLGGLTVLFLLPTGVSVCHATLAQTFFCIVTSLAFFTSRWWLSDHELPPGTTGKPARFGSGLPSRGPSTFALCVALTLAVYVQLILGALMRHTGSGLAVADFPLAYGQIFPALSPKSVAAYNERLIQTDVRLAAEGAVTSTQILIHMLHRLWALVVAGTVIWASIRLRKDSFLSKRLPPFSTALILLLLLQVTLGAWTVLSMKAVPITTAHVAVGALLLATCVLVTLHVARLSKAQVFKLSYSVSGREAIA
jgi:cytochrome c oxidase assembly protein subunit 15